MLYTVRNVVVFALLFPLALETCMYINTSHILVQHSVQQHSISHHQICNTASRIKIVN